MRRIWAALSAAGILSIAIAGTALADVEAIQTNPSASDTVAWCIVNHRENGETSVGEAQSASAQADDGSPGNGDMYRHGSWHRVNNCGESPA